MRILVVANDVTPGFGLPVAAPGLRAWSLATGLRAHGHDVDVVVDARPLAKASPGATPPSSTDATALPLDRLDDVVATHAPDAVVFTNSNHVHRLSTDHDCAIVYDFFAPKMLEQGLGAERHAPAALARLRERKIAALQRADVVAVNGPKKHGYVLAWLLQGDRDVRTVRVVDTPFGVPPRAPTPHEGPVRLAVAGYVQAWSRAGAHVEQLLAAVDELDIELHVLVAQHWGGDGSPTDGGYGDLVGHPRVTTHPTLAFDAFRDLIADVDVTIDVFEHHLEREYAMVTRTLVALCTGAAVVHPDHTEVAGYVRRHEAGWLLPDGRPEALLEHCRRIADARDEVFERRENAHRLARGELAPEVATAALARALEEVVT